MFLSPAKKTGSFVLLFPWNQYEVGNCARFHGDAKGIFTSICSNMFSLNFDLSIECSHWKFGFSTAISEKRSDGHPATRPFKINLQVPQHLGTHFDLEYQRYLVLYYCTLCEENGGQPSIFFGRYPISTNPMFTWPIGRQNIVKRRILDLRSEEGWSVPYRANRGREIEGWSRTCLRFCICCAQPRLANVTQSRLSKVLANMHKLFVQNTSHFYIIISNHTIWTHEFCHFNGNKHW